MKQQSVGTRRAGSSHLVHLRKGVRTVLTLRHEEAIAQPTVRGGAGVRSGDGVPEPGHGERVVDQGRMDMGVFTDDADSGGRGQLDGTLPGGECASAVRFDGCVGRAADDAGACGQATFRRRCHSHGSNHRGRRDHGRQQGRIQPDHCAQGFGPGVAADVEQQRPDGVGAICLPGTGEARTQPVLGDVDASRRTHDIGFMACQPE